ncbi:hypothetical protein DL765_008143 [Monosporascus sp. GIB2]|nr:hypothetical protein DL765_008143 [Monosporascus sp. GIB2]
MVSGKAIAKDVGGQPEGFDMERMMKVSAKLSSESKRDIHLDWKDFESRLSEENRLRGSDIWEMWKTAVWVALMAIGYRDGDSAKLTQVDEAKLAAAVVTNVKEGPMAVVTGFARGTEMIKLQFVKWGTKRSALDHVVDFKNLVRRCNEVDMPVNDDFVAEFRGKKQLGGNTHNAKRQRWDKPVWDKNG